MVHRAWRSAHAARPRQCPGTLLIQVVESTCTALNSASAASKRVDTEGGDKHAVRVRPCAGYQQLQHRLRGGMGGGVGRPSGLRTRRRGGFHTGPGLGEVA